MKIKLKVGDITSSSVLNLVNLDILTIESENK